MPRLEYFVVCEMVSIDEDTKRISLFNVLENITQCRSDQLRPGMAGRITANCAVVSCWIREPEDGPTHSIELHITMPGQSEPLKMQFEAEWPSDMKRARLVHRFGPFPRMPQGELTFDIFFNGQRQARHTIDVEVIELPQDIASDLHTDTIEPS